MAEYKHSFVDDNPYLVYSVNVKQDYEPDELDALVAGIKVADAGKVIGVDEDGKLALLTIGD